MMSAKPATGTATLAPVLALRRADPLAAVLGRWTKRRTWPLILVTTSIAFLYFYSQKLSTDFIAPNPLDFRLTLKYSLDQLALDYLPSLGWLIAVPAFVMYYVRQLPAAEAMFSDLYQAGVTGLSEAEFGSFVARANRWLGNPLPFLAIPATLLIILGSGIYGFLTTPLEDMLRPSPTWLDWLSFALTPLGIVFQVALLVVLVRFGLVCWLLEQLLQRDRIHPRFLLRHELYGFQPVASLVDRTALTFALIAFNVSFDYALTLWDVVHIPGFSVDGEFIVLNGMTYVFALAILVAPLWPLFRTLAALAVAKRRMLRALDEPTSEVVWKAYASRQIQDIADALSNVDPARRIVDELPDSAFSPGKARGTLLIALLPVAAAVVPQAILLLVKAVHT